MTFFLLVWTFVFVLLLGALSHATEIAGDWQAEDHAGKRLFYYFGTDHTFFFEGDASWIQGTYTTEPDAASGQVDLFIQDGSHVEDVGRSVRYVYDIHDNLLTLSVTDQDRTHQSTTLEGANPVGNTVFIGINTDPPDEDDKEDEPVWNIYASCFVMSSMAE